jgi:hypothetical protein
VHGSGWEELWSVGRIFAAVCKQVEYDGSRDLFDLSASKLDFKFRTKTIGTNEPFFVEGSLPPAF